MDLTEITETVMNLAKKVGEKDAILSPDSALVADLGLESVQVIEFLCEVEDYFDIVIGSYCMTLLFIVIVDNVSLLSNNLKTSLNK